MSNWYFNGDEVYNVTIAYLSREWSGEVELNEEHTEWRWFAANEIPENISPPITPLIEQSKRLVSKIEKDVLWDGSGYLFFIEGALK